MENLKKGDLVKHLKGEFDNGNVSLVSSDGVVFLDYFERDKPYHQGGKHISGSFKIDELQKVSDAEPLKEGDLVITRSHLGPIRQVSDYKCRMATVLKVYDDGNVSLGCIAEDVLPAYMSRPGLLISGTDLIKVQGTSLSDFPEEYDYYFGENSFYRN